MKNAFAIVGLLTILYGCGGGNTTATQKLADSVVKQKNIDLAMAAGERPDSEQAGPTYNEVLKETFARYNQIKKIDTIIVDGSDSLKVNFKFYCLHDSTLVIPAKYDWGNKRKQEFRTHNFATKITVIRNRDTVFNHVVLKSWFNKVTDESLKQYATFITANMYKYEPKDKHLVFTFSISIPTTDVGIGASLLIDKNGGYEVTDRPIN